MTNEPGANEPGANEESLGETAAAADRFKPYGEIAGIREFGGGNINATFLVTLDSGEERRFILQRLNAQVFPRPDRIMRNLRTVSEHVRKRLKSGAPGGSGSGAGRRWEIPRALPARGGGDHWIGPGGSFWRAISFIEGAASFAAIQDSAHAGEVGYALGMFQSLLSDLPPETLTDTLRGFHDTPGHLRRYDEVLGEKGAGGSPEVDYGLHFIEE